MVVGLGPGDIVLDRDTVPLHQRDTAPQFSAYVCCGETARWIKMPHGRKVGLGPDHIVIDGDPPPPKFLYMSIVAKWSPISATAEHLLKYKMTVKT